MMTEKMRGLEADLNGALRKIEELENRLKNLIEEIEMQLDFYLPHIKR